MTHAPTVPAPRRQEFVPLSSPAHALWNQRQAIAALLERFRALSAAVDRPSTFSFPQWAQIAAYALEFKPDLILELGRERGNSTSCFLEVANQLGSTPTCRLVSLCLSDDWFRHTRPRLKKVVLPEWFAPGEILQRNIFDHDFAEVLAGAERCLVFWDAHGFAVAEGVLGKLLPLLVTKAHAVLLHDMSDLRYEGVPPDYGRYGLWKGANAAEPALFLGHVFSRVAQSISLIDFSTRNRLPLHSAAESLYEELADDVGRCRELRELLGDDFFSLQAHWFWFSVNEAPGKLTFPRFTLSGDAARMDSAEVRAEQAALALTELEGRLNRLRENANSSDPSQLLRIEEQVVALKQMLGIHRHELAVLCAQKRETERLWRAAESSVGWRLLNRWRRHRDCVAPVGTSRRRLYRTAVQALRRLY